MKRTNLEVKKQKAKENLYLNKRKENNFKASPNTTINRKKETKQVRKEDLARKASNRRGREMIKNHINNNKPISYKKEVKEERKRKINNPSPNTIKVGKLPNKKRVARTQKEHLEY